MLKQKPVSSADRSWLIGVPGAIKEKIFSTRAHPLAQEIERRWEQCLSRALSVLDIPSRDEVLDLHKRLDNLLSRCEALLGEETGNVQSRADFPSQEKPPEMVARD